MRFQVPQFIDVEDKVFGPFTFKQFIYIAGGTGLCFVLLKILPRFLAIIVIIPVAIFTLGLAFYKLNNRPFIQIVEAFFKYTFGGRLYIWQRRDRGNARTPSPAEQYLRMQVPKMEGSKLKDLTWSLDAKKGEDEPVK